MIPVTFTVAVDDRNMLLIFKTLPMALKTNLRATVTALTQALLMRVRAAEPVRTGRLRAQTRAFVSEGPEYVRGSVRVLGTIGQAHNIAAAALEYGAHRTVDVRGYQRRSIAVRAYERRANIAARRFLRGPAEAMRDRALAELQKAVDKSVKEAASAP